MNSKKLHCAVVGAANLDIGGFPKSKNIMHDSNPGHVIMSAGGVGRNIACNLARMGICTQLITALGNDTHSTAIRKDCAQAGVGLAHAFVFDDASTSVYLFVADESGDMQLAVNDMDIYARLDCHTLRSRLDMLNRMDAVILDANLSAEALHFLATNIHVPLLADAVSTVKAPRLIQSLPCLTAFKPNAIEAEMLTGIPVNDAASAKHAARKLIDMGLGRVYISMSTKGVCCADAHETLFLPGMPLMIKSATGAGDAFTAALAWAELKGLSLRESAFAGLAAASIAVESLETVNPAMTESLLLHRMTAMTQSSYNAIWEDES